MTRRTLLIIAIAAEIVGFVGLVLALLHETVWQHLGQSAADLIARSIT